MALKLYGGTDSNTGLEFMVRGETLERAKETAEFLRLQLDNADFLVASNFSEPIRLDSPQPTAPFPTPSAVNGESPDENVTGTAEFFTALRMDGVSESVCSTSNFPFYTVGESFQIIAWIEFINYEGGGEQTILANWTDDDSPGTKVYRLFMSNNILQFDISADGTNIFTTSVELDPVHGTSFWVRAAKSNNITALYTSKESPFINPSDITWVTEGVSTTTIVTLNTNEAALITAGAYMVDSSDTPTSDVINGSIGRALLIDTPAINFPGSSILLDMYPDRDYDGGNLWISNGPQHELWDLFGRANVGIPIAGGGTIAFIIDGSKYLDAVDSIAESITGLISLAVWAEVTEIIPGITRYFIGKGFDAEDENSWGIGMFSNSSATESNPLGLVGDGTDTDVVILGTANSIPLGEGLWMAMEYNPADKSMSFFVADSPINTAANSIAWTQIGSATSDLSGNTLLASNAIAIVGSFAGEEGKSVDAFIARALVFEGSLDAGTLRKEMYPDRDYTGGTEFISSTTPDTWFLNGDIATVQV